MPKGLTEIRCVIIGYGMGRFHAREVERTQGLKLVAVCDIDPERLRQAKSDFPSIQTYRNTDDLLAEQDFDLAIIATPHDSHAPLALKCLEAKKHVVVEKPMCIRVKEATRMIETARERGVMLTVYHNRHWDGDFLALQDIVRGGFIGKIFRVEMWWGGYGHPGHGWRSEKKVCGGLFYDWGAHYIEWLLTLIPSRIERVVGFSWKLKWEDVSIEDHVEAVIRFADGVMADVVFSRLAMERRERWLVLGTDGAIVDDTDQKCFRVHFLVNGHRAETKVPYRRSEWEAFYRNVVGHLLRGEELEIKPEHARRVIAVMETAEKSAKQGGKALPVPYE